MYLQINFLSPSLRYKKTGLVDNTGPGCGVPGRRGPGIYGKDGVTGSVVFVTTAHDQRSQYCHLVSFRKVSKCQARLLVINNRILSN